MAANKLNGGSLVAVAYPANEFLVWIPHGAQANSERLLGCPSGQDVQG
jgi:hypothetical protein